MKTYIFGIIAVLALIASAAAWFVGPCELYTFAPASKTPARCMMK
ncbi:hypothetical protein ABR737_01535 [Streptomyces sp. Edi2]